MKLGLNLLAGLTSSIWSALVGLTVVPFYLRYLGVEAYGLIGFFVTMQAVLALLDMGLAPTINREVARCSASGVMSEAGRLLHTLAVVYWGVALLIALVVVGLSPLIAGNWLQSSTLSVDSVERAVALMGVVIACRWPVGLYQGALIGAQRLVTASAISMSMVALGSLGALAVLSWVAPTVEAFFIWQACVGMLHILILRQAAWRAVGGNQAYQFDLTRFKQVWRFSAGMGGVAVLGALLMQLDKVLLSRMLSLEDFGHYVLAGVVANGLYIFLTPTFNVIYPRFTSHIAAREFGELENLYRTGTRGLLAILFPVAAMVAVFSEDLLNVWTGDPSTASSTASVVSLFIIGTALNGAMHFPYALQLAYGVTRLPLLINSVLVAIMVPATYALASRFGAEGGAGAWALLNAIYLFLGTFLTHRSLLKGLGIKWLVGDVGLPLLVSMLVVVGCGRWAASYELKSWANLGLGVLLCSLSFVLVVVLSPKLRVVINRFLSDFLETRLRLKSSN